MPESTLNSRLIPQTELSMKGSNGSNRGKSRGGGGGGNVSPPDGVWHHPYVIAPVSLTVRLVLGTLLALVMKYHY